ncbi:hypothetical protein NP493_15g00054 [Ridgeia piscesae]|uniref:Uncharacterized protein n=1 Tax=Ridgeia piscesae TaxID=27915 RepID=A0AAD9UKX0_RIDPI|nr:hypothetical protein NP493_15g00054 [Ridgeia piscesae]
MRLLTSGQHASCPIRMLYLCQIIAYSTQILLTTHVFVRAFVWCVYLRAYMYVCECAHVCLNNKTINTLPIYKLPYSNAIYNSMRNYGLRNSTVSTSTINPFTQTYFYSATTESREEKGETTLLPLSFLSRVTAVLVSAQSWH